MNLRDRLKYASLNPDKGKINKTCDTSKYDHLIDRLKAEIIDSMDGRCLLKKTVYPYHHSSQYGQLNPKNISPVGIQRLLRKNEFSHTLNPQKILFMDTETTGLSGGTGTYIFLMGLGYFQEDCFCIDQFFLPDYSEESAFLNQIHKRMNHFDFLVTYNGKSFDYPLLATRFKFNRFNPDLDFQWHLDLLHSTRTLWKRRVDNCSLGHIEKVILGLFREQDIQGEFIPQVYFDYLSNHQTDLLPLVFEHNRQDIFSLALLACHISQFAESPGRGMTSHGIDYYSLGRFYLLGKNLDRALESFEKALSYGLPDPFRYDCIRYIGRIHKHFKQWDNALKFWEQLVRETSHGDFHSVIEMAKYYEHQLKDYGKARQLIESYIRMNEQGIGIRKIIHSRSKMTLDESLNKRLNRLMRKERAVKNGLSS